MAEERNVGLARAPEETRDEDATKAELQRRMEEARESITQTVTEIRDTVVNQYQSVKDSVVETLDWRQQFRKRPIAWSIGALSAGFIVGYSLAGALKGGRSQDGGYYPTSDESDVFSRTGATPTKYPAYEGDVETPQYSSSTAASHRSYAAQAITGGSYGSSAYVEGAPSRDTSERGSDYTSAAGLGAPSTSGYGASSLPSSSGSYEAPSTAEAEPQKPSLLERFKETQAFDRLQTEVASLGDRFIEELSKTAQTVVLPLLFAKIKDLVGVDLSNKQQGQGNNGGTQQRRGAASTSGATSTGATSTGSSSAPGAGSSSSGNTGASTSYPGRADDPALGGSQSTGSARGGSTAGNESGGSTYGTSENQGYGS